MSESDFIKKKFKTDIGQHAKVERFEKMDVDSTRWNSELRRIGEGLKWYEDLRYEGSAAVHIYTSPALGQMFFISQASSLGQTSEPAAAAALSDLGNVCKNWFGNRTQRLRSGF